MLGGRAVPPRLRDLGYPAVDCSLEVQLAVECRRDRARTREPARSLDERQDGIDRAQATEDVREESLDGSQRGRDAHQRALDVARLEQDLPESERSHPSGVATSARRRRTALEPLACAPRPPS